MTNPDLSAIPSHLHLGTSSFSSPDWCGPFYPPGASPSEYLTYYSSRFHTVEIDATWHAMPMKRTVESWAAKVPPGFVFAAKVPKVITHERYLDGCWEEWTQFLRLMDLLGEKKGPILLQFPYVSRSQNADESRSGHDFQRRIEHFLPQIPREGRFVIEVRNRTWIAPPLLDLLRSRGIALALVAYYTMPGAAELMRSADPVTADFAYLRFLGNHKAMDLSVSRARENGGRRSDWGELLVDRTVEMRAWIPPIQVLLDRLPDVYAYFNNHYAGFAPGSIEQFARLWGQGSGEPDCEAAPERR